MDQVGILCYHCHQGVFMSRRFWRYWTDEWGTQWGTPDEDIDLAALEEEWRWVEAKQRRFGIDATALPSTVNRGYSNPLAS